MQVALLALTCLVFLVGATLGNTAFLSESIQSQKGRKLDIQDDPFFRFGDPADVDPPPPAAATSASFHQPTHIAVIDSNDLLTEPAPNLDEDLSNDGGSDSTEDGFDDMDDFGWDDEEWGDDDWDEDDWGDQGLPHCSTLTEAELASMTDCDNSTIVEEVRLRDPLFERLFSQLWHDTQLAMNEESAINGEVIDPFDVDGRLPGGGPIEHHHEGGGANLDVKLMNMKVYGLSTINLTESKVTRSENLTDFDLNLTFSFDALVINGSYSLKGIVMWSQLDSRGWKPFDITIKKANVSYRMKFDLIDPQQSWSTRSCSDESFLFDDPNVLITEIEMPLSYEDVNFKFVGLGAFANNMINTMGIYMLQTQEATIKEHIRKNIKTHVNSLIC